MPRWLGWPLLALVMGFNLGGSVFWALYGPNTTREQADAAYEYRSADHTAEKEKADEALARYTWWLTTFTLIFALATIGLVGATIGLFSP